MFDFNSILLPSAFKFKFDRVAGTKDKWLIKISSLITIPNADNGAMQWINYGEYTESTDGMLLSEDITKSDCTVLPTEHEVKREFIRFRELCPVYTVGQELHSSLFINSDKEEEQLHLKEKRSEVFDKLLTGISILLYGELNGIDYAKRCIKWLRSTDFYYAPASTKYHDSEPGGLLKHTLKVVNKMLELLHLPSYSNVDMPKAILTALVHDWCKINYYEQYFRNVKDDITGVWSKESAYKCSGSSIPFGHGITSMYITQKFFRITMEQALAIRWHMGEYDVSESQKHELMDANENYPMVLLLQFADRLSIVNSK